MARPAGRNGAKRTLYLGDREWKLLGRKALQLNLSVSQLVTRIVVEQLPGLSGAMLTRAGDERDGRDGGNQPRAGRGGKAVAR
jgi:hypothetical protein